MTKSQCWQLYLIALREIEKLQGKPVLYHNGCGGNVVDKMLAKANEIGI